MKLKFEIIINSFIIKIKRIKTLRKIYFNKFYNDFKKRKYKLPIKLNIEFTSLCNLDCEFCSLDKKRKTSMTKETLIRMLDDISTSKLKIGKISIVFGGESLIHPEFRQLLDIIAKYKNKVKNFPQITLTTNAVLLKKRAKDIIESKSLDLINFSIDGGNKKDYEYIRKVKWEIVLDNVNYFLQKNDNKIKTGVISIFTNSKPHISEEFLKILNKVDYFAPRLPHNFLGKKDLKLKGERFLPKKGFCGHIFINLAVFADGKVSACCLDLNQQVVVGDMNEDTLYNIFYGKIKNNIMDKMKEHKRYLLSGCRYCSDSIFTHKNSCGIIESKGKICEYMKNNPQFLNVT